MASTHIALKPLEIDTNYFVWRPDLSIPLEIFRIEKDVVIYKSLAGSFYVVGGEELHYGGDNEKTANKFFRALVRRRKR
jgi:hypothetical protein